MYKARNIFLIAPFLLFLLLAACDGNEDGGSDVAATVSANPTLAATASGSDIASEVSQPGTNEAAVVPTDSPPTPTNTPVPLAALVNGEGLPQAVYESELVREELLFAEAGGPDPEYRTAILTRLIDQLLISQAAANFGITLTDEMVEADLGIIRAQLEEENGPTAFNDWLAANLYNEDEFRSFWRFDMLQRLVVAQVVAEVGLTDEHVRARYIQVDDEALAQQIITLLDDGNDFGDLARQYSLDETTSEFGGELDYFTRGELLVPELEAAAFALQIGQHSEVVAVNNEGTGLTTYYLIEVTDRADRELHSDTYYARQQTAWLTWLEQQRTAATVDIFIATD